MLVSDEPLTTTNTYHCCCLDIECVPMAKRPNLARSCADRIHAIWSIYWNYINFPLCNGAKACTPVILMTIYLLQPGTQKGLLYNGLYAYIMTMYSIQWVLYECPALFKNDMYGNYLCNVPAYYYFMGRVYDLQLQFVQIGLLVIGTITGWLFMGAAAYKDKTSCLALLLIAIAYAILKTYLCIMCAAIKYDAVYCNNPPPLIHPANFIQVPKPPSAAAVQTSAEPAPTWDCICCMVRENMPICNCVFVTVGISLICIVAAWYVFGSRIVFIASISSTFSYRTNFNMAMFNAVSNTLYLIAPQITYYLHNTDPQNTRFERIQIDTKEPVNAQNLDEPAKAMMSFKILYLFADISSTIFSWAFVVQGNFTVHSPLAALTNSCTLMGIATLFKLTIDLSTSKLYKEEGVKIASGQAITNLAPEVITNPIALDEANASIYV